MQASRRAVLSGGVAAVLLGGCSVLDRSTTRSAPQLPRPRSTSITLSIKMLRRRTSPRWATQSLDVSGPDDAATDLVVCDLVSGKRLWRFDGGSGKVFDLPKGTKFQGFSAHTVGPAPLVLGTVKGGPSGSAGNSDFAVVAVDGRTGVQKWVAAESASTEQWLVTDVVVLGGTADAVLVGLQSGADRYRTLALDPRTGRTKWSKDGAYPAFYTDSCVLVARSGRMRGEDTVAVSSVALLDIKTGKQLPINGIPHDGDALIVAGTADASEPYLRDGLLIAWDSPAVNVTWALDVQRRLFVRGLEGASFAGRAADESVLFAGIQRDYTTSDQRAVITTQGEGEATPTEFTVEVSSVSSGMRVIAISDDVLWTDQGVFDRAGRKLAQPVLDLQFVTDSLAVTPTAVLKVSVTK